MIALLKELGEECDRQTINISRLTALNCKTSSDVDCFIATLLVVAPRYRLF